VKAYSSVPALAARELLQGLHGGRGTHGSVVSIVVVILALEVFLVGSNGLFRTQTVSNILRIAISIQEQCALKTFSGGLA
jgi:hypothetical protein